jgi:hypothetical protein
VPFEATEEVKAIRVSPDELARRVMRHLARREAPPKYRGYVQPLWVAVQELTGFGSTYSCAICVQYGYDPTLRVKGKSRL